MPINHTFKIPKTAHYSSIGTPSKDIKHLWIACHGYGQLASRFIEKFEEIADSKTLVIAPEGLSRFYFGGSFTGEVAASWMTKGDRLLEIEDYCNWLDALYDEYVPQLNPDVQITIFGFSQGVATVFRWLQARRRRCHNVVIWAGRVPEDITYEPLLPYWDEKQMIFVYGLQDKFLTEDRVQAIQKETTELGLTYQTLTFDGKHVIDRPMLKKIGTLIKK